MGRSAHYRGSAALPLVSVNLVADLRIECELGGQLASKHPSEDAARREVAAQAMHAAARRSRSRAKKERRVRRGVRVRARDGPEEEL